MAYLIHTIALLLYDFNMETFLGAVQNLRNARIDSLTTASSPCDVIILQAHKPPTLTFDATHQIS